MRSLVYLDTCCLNRPSDDQRQPRVHLESEAVLTILAAVEAGRGLEWLGSAVLRTEVDRNPDPERRQRVQGLLQAATYWVTLEPQDVVRGAALEHLAGFAAFDALHVAVAERGRANVLLTTDDRFVRRAARHSGILEVLVENPLAWLGRTFPAGVPEEPRGTDDA